MLDVMDRLDAWVKSRGNGRYVRPDQQDETTPIQQVREEIAGLVDAIVKHCTPIGNVLEIGLGEFGGTNVLWRMLFSGWIVTVEKNATFWENFRERERLPLHLQDRAPIIGDSLDPHSVDIATRLGPYTFLHIDGNHDYGAVRADYLNYAPMVKAPGLIAMHDALTPGVGRFAAELERGEIDGKPHDLERIIHSTHVGIVYEVVA